MDQRLAQMLQQVCEHPGIAPDELARRLNVSTRTLRTYTSRINTELAGTATILHARGAGYSLDVSDEAALGQVLAESSSRARHMLPETQGDRIAYLLNDLLQRADWVTLDALADALYTSRRTISEDIKQVESELGRFGLTLERRPHYGMRVEGAELGRRLCMARSALADASQPGKAVDSRTLEIVSACIDRVTTQTGFSINGVVYQNLVIHIAVAVVRINSNAYVPMELSQLQAIQSSSVYEVARRIAHEIEGAFAVELPDEEIAYIALHLSGRRLIQGEDVEDGLVISDEVWDVVSQILEAVWSVFRFDLRDDLELRMNLARHIVPLTVRLRYHMRLQNPLLADIKTRFPLAWQMANEASAVLARAYRITPSADEAGYIALAFALALERQKEGAPKKNILVVCASGAGSAKLLEHQYRQEFGAYLDSVITCDVSHIDEVDFSHIDYVFTTVPIPRVLPVPVRRVRFFLDSAEIGDVRRILADTPSSSSAAGFFDERLFLPHLACTSRKEVIAALCARMREVVGAPERLEEMVWERERLAPSAFGGLIAMPHPLEPVTEHTHVAVALLDEAILWAGQPVRIVFLVSISTHKGRDLDGLYRSLVRFMNEGGMRDRLLHDQTFEALCALLGEED